MANKRKPEGGSGGIRVGNITGSKGIAVGNHASVHMTEGVSGEALAKIFETINQKASALPEGPTKIMAQQAVAGLEEEAKKGDKAQEGKLNEWFNFLAQTAPDVWDVAVTTLANPVAGIAKVIQLVAKKAKEEHDTKK